MFIFGSLLWYSLFLVKLSIPTYRFRSLFIIACSALLCSGLLSGAMLEPGMAFPVLKNMQDQHEQAYEMPAATQHVAVAYTMSVGKSANKYFASKGASYLPRSAAVFIANIDGMPAVGRFFAMPKMRKYPHRIMLADAEGLLDDFPQEDGRVTVFDLDAAGKITMIRFWDPTAEESPF